MRNVWGRHIVEILRRSTSAYADDPSIGETILLMEERDGKTGDRCPPPLRGELARLSSLAESAKQVVMIFDRRRFVIPAFVLLVLFWSSTFSVVKIGVHYSPPVLFAGLRSIVGGFSMLLAALLWGGRPSLRRNVGTYASLSMLNVVLFMGLQTFAIMLLPSGTAAVLIYLSPYLPGFWHGSCSANRSPRRSSPDYCWGSVG